METGWTDGGADEGINDGENEGEEDKMGRTEGTAVRIDGTMEEGTTDGPLVEIGVTVVGE